MSDFATRNRSYAAEAAHPVGSVATFTETVRRNLPDAEFKTWTPIEIPAGAPVRIVDYTNAGFRGIEVAVRFHDRYVSGISAGLLA